ncbi:MAG: FliI/YscN family ATPase [Planctomycetes bacterium]|nr:FliI/YscN family ATPase [Planctomycetota bacterium]
MERYLERVEAFEPHHQEGVVHQVIGLSVEATGLRLPVGGLAEIAVADGWVEAQVVGFRDGRTVLLPLSDAEGLCALSRVRARATRQYVPVGPGLLGRVLDGAGRPIDGRGPVRAEAWVPLVRSAPSAMDRERIVEPFPLGIRSIDALLTCGRGSRLGIFSGSGVGKSVLLGMMARFHQGALAVVGLVGERGREVREFLERDLGGEGLARAVVVVSTSDEPAPCRIRAALAATAIAESFREAGQDVLLMMDSATRIAHAQREIGLSAGEPPSTRGYPPSVYRTLATLFERAGSGARGSITALYTVLVEADDMDEPIADAARSFLDGHIWLSRDLAQRSQFPAVDPLSSVSRLMLEVTTPEQRRHADIVRRHMAIYRQNEDLIRAGAYVRGADPRLDAAVGKMEAIEAFLRQDRFESAPMEETHRRLAEVAS